MGKNKDKEMKLNNEKIINQVMKTPPEELYTKYSKGHKAMKGASKSETAIIRAACCHHYKSKKGKIRPLIDFQSNAITCRGCKHRWSGQLMSQEEIDKVCNKYIEILDAGKYFTTAMDFGKKAQDFFIKNAIMSSNTAKVFGRLTELVAKDGAKKRGNKKGKKRHDDMSIPGTYRENR